MFDFLNNISDDAVIWFSLTSCLMFPLSTPVILFIALMIKCFKSADRDDERNRLIMQMMRDELYFSDYSDDETELQGEGTENEDETDIVEDNENDDEATQQIKSDDDHKESDNNVFHHSEDEKDLEEK